MVWQLDGMTQKKILFKEHTELKTHTKIYLEQLQSLQSKRNAREEGAGLKSYDLANAAGV